MSNWTVVGFEGTRSTPRDWSIERDILDTVGATLVTALCDSEQEAAEALRYADVGLAHTHPVTGLPVLDISSTCRALILGGVGHEHVDIAGATERGIAVANVPDYCVEEVTDHALALLFALARGLMPLNASTRRGEWNHRAGGELMQIAGRQLGLYGFGRIARRLAEKASAIGIAVLAFDPYVDPSVMKNLSVKPAENLAHLLSSSDFVSLHTHETPETEKSINADSIQLMKPGSLLINVSRGGLIDEVSLFEALRSGYLNGAALDVMAVEPFDMSSPLFSLENLIVTPHSAWYSEQAGQELSRLMAHAAIQALQGKLPDNTINAKEKPYFWWLDS